MVDVFQDGVQIHGNTTEKTQLEVRGPAGQTTEPLQEWQDPSGVPLSQITADGRLEIGDPSAPSALVQANDENVSPTGSVKRGIQTRGNVDGAVTEPLSWSATELEFSGTGGVASDQAAQRVQIVHDNSGDSSNADLRAGDFEAINRAGSSGTPTGILTGVHIGVTNEVGAYLNEANGLKIEAPINDSTIAKLHGIQIEDVNQGDENFALHTGEGLVHLGDVIELVEQLTQPSVPPASGTVQLYAKDDKLYAWDGATHMDLTGGGGGTDENVAVSATDTTPGYLDGKLVMGSTKLTKTVLSGGADEDLQLDVDPSQIDLDELGDVNAPTPSNGQALVFNSGSGQWESATLASADEKVGVSANDTTPGYLFSKLAAGSSKLTITETNDGGDEDITLDVNATAIDHTQLLNVGTNTHAQIDSHITNTSNPHNVTAAQAGAAADGMLKVSSNDTTADYLFNKLTAGSGIQLTEQNNGGNENVQIGVADNYVLNTGDTMTGQLFVDGGANVIQLRVQAHSTQSANVVEIEDSTSADRIVIDENFRLGIGTNDPQSILSVNGGPIRLTATAGSDSSYSTLEQGGSGQFSVLQRRSSGDSIINLDPDADDGSSVSTIRMFNNVNTTGAKQLILYKGNGTASILHRFGTDFVTINENTDDIDFRVKGTTDQSLLVANAGTNNVGIGINIPAMSAKLEISTSTGALLLPRMTTTQRNALTAIDGMVIYNFTSKAVEAYENGTWVNL